MSFVSLEIIPFVSAGRDPRTSTSAVCGALDRDSELTGYHLLYVNKYF